MAWNRSDEAGRVAPRPPNKARRFLFGGRGATSTIIVIAFVFIGAAVAWWCLSKPSNRTVDQSNVSDRRIKEVSPAVRAKPAVTNAVKRADPNARPTKPGEVLNGYRMLANGRLHKVRGVVTNECAKFSLADKVFDEDTDRSIGHLLLAAPGAPMLGDSSEYYDGFDEDFRKSLKTPIVIGKDDDEETAWLKKEVISIRGELKERMDRGEDIVKVMRDTRDQLRDIAIYKDQVEQMVREHALDISNQKDYEDLLAAANQMLKERGSEPLAMPRTFKSAVRRWKKEMETRKETEK